MLLASLVIALKYFDDETYSNKHYSKLGGVPMNELYSLEETFLKKIGFRCFIDQKSVTKYVAIFEDI